MAKKKSAKRRQQSRQRKALKRKAKKRTLHRAMSPRSPRALLRQASNWPLHECLMTKDWQDTHNIVQILVARRSPSGQIACGVFLVDLGCLGVKNAYAKQFNSSREYRRLLRQSFMQSQKMKKTSLDLAAKIVHESIAYARELGFSPHRDIRDAMPFLGDADPAACDTPVPLGDGTGKPFFTSGPYDDVPQIMAKLRKKLGPEGFGYLVRLEDNPDLFRLEEQDLEFLLED